MSTSGEIGAHVKASSGRGRGCGTTMSLELFGGPNGVTSSSGSDQSPSSLNYDPHVLTRTNLC